MSLQPSQPFFLNAESAFGCPLLSVLGLSGPEPRDYIQAHGPLTLLSLTSPFPLRLARALLLLSSSSPGLCAFSTALPLSFTLETPEPASALTLHHCACGATGDCLLPSPADGPQSSSRYPGASAQLTAFLPSSLSGLCYNTLVFYLFELLHLVLL